MLTNNRALRMEHQARNLRRAAVTFLFLSDAPVGKGSLAECHGHRVAYVRVGLPQGGRCNQPILTGGHL